MSTDIQPLDEAIDSEAGKYEQARCALDGCGAFLHLVVTSDQPVYLSFTAADLQDANGWLTSWEIRCEAGHVVLLPVDTAEDSYVFGRCRCEPEEPGTEDDCGHGDVARLRRVVMPAE